MNLQSFKSTPDGLKQRFKAFGRKPSLGGPVLRVILKLLCSLFLTNFRFCHCSKIVLVAIQDEGSLHMTPAIDSFKKLGATDPVQPGYRASFALVGYAGQTTMDYSERCNQRNGTQ